MAVGVNTLTLCPAPPHLGFIPERQNPRSQQKLAMNDCGCAIHKHQTGKPSCPSVATGFGTTQSGEVHGTAGDARRHTQRLDGSLRHCANERHQAVGAPEKAELPGAGGRAVFVHTEELQGI